MDIQISSNFERLLFDLYDRDGATLAKLMTDFRETGKLKLSDKAYAALKAEFAAARADDAETKATIATILADTGELLDPHTAVGVAAGKHAHNGKSPLVVLATAHPAKFPQAVHDACGVQPPLPPHLHDLFERKEQYDTLDASADAIKQFIEKTL